MANAEKEEFKVVILGDGGVGKSCITIRFTQNVFQDKYDPTVEDLYRKEVELYRKDFPNKEDKHVPGSYIVEILDSAGQESFAGSRDLYYKSGRGFILVFSVGVSSSLNEVIEHYEAIKRARGMKGSELPPFMIVGNKCDLDFEKPTKNGELRVVTQAEGRALTDKLTQDGAKATYMECSALANINIKELFTCIVKDMKIAKIAEEKAIRKKERKCAIL